MDARLVVQSRTAAEAVTELRAFGFHVMFRQIIRYLGRFEAAEIRGQVEVAATPKVRTMR